MKCSFCFKVAIVSSVNCDEHYCIDHVSKWYEPKKSIEEQFRLKPIPRDKLSYRNSKKVKNKKVSTRKLGKSKYG
jgi:hypothetical protein|tara:strand:+ start:254 stop:478 length:225 start_codon:yes stop_codon:yes gene_type:complete